MIKIYQANGFVLDHSISKHKEVIIGLFDSHEEAEKAREAFHLSRKNVHYNYHESEDLPEGSVKERLLFKTSDEHIAHYSPDPVKKALSKLSSNDRIALIKAGMLNPDRGIGGYYVSAFRHEPGYCYHPFSSISFEEGTLECGICLASELIHGELDKAYRI